MLWHVSCWHAGSRAAPSIREGDLIDVAVHCCILGLIESYAKLGVQSFPISGSCSRPAAPLPVVQGRCLAPDHRVADVGGGVHGQHAVSCTCCVAPAIHSELARVCSLTIELPVSLCYSVSFLEERSTGSYERFLAARAPSRAALLAKRIGSSGGCESQH